MVWSCGIASLIYEFGHLCCRQHPRQYKYLCHSLGSKWVEYLTSCQVEFELGFSFSLTIAKIADGLSQDIQVQDLGWKSTRVCNTSAFLRFKFFHSWAVEFLNQKGGGLYLPFNPQIRVSQILKCKKTLNFFWLSSPQLLPKDGEPGHKTQCWHLHAFVRKTGLHFCSISTDRTFAMGGAGCCVRMRTGF